MRSFTVVERSRRGALPFDPEGRTTLRVDGQHIFLDVGDGHWPTIADFRQWLAQVQADLTAATTCGYPGCCLAEHVDHPNGHLLRGAQWPDRRDRLEAALGSGP